MEAIFLDPSSNGVRFESSYQGRFATDWTSACTAKWANRKSGIFCPRMQGSQKHFILLRHHIQMFEQKSNSYQQMAVNIPAIVRKAAIGIAFTTERRDHSLGWSVFLQSSPEYSFHGANEF
jgi:hypothetical protein